MAFADLIAKLSLDNDNFLKNISASQGATENFAGGFTKAIEGIKDELGGLGELAASAFKLVTQPAALAAESIAALGVASFKAGESIEAAFNKISFSTGAVGKTLEGLQDDFRAVFAQVPESAGKVSEAITLLNQRLGLSGEALQSLSIQFLELTKRTGEDLPTAIKAGTQAFQVFNIEIAKQGEALNFLLGVSQKTGASVTEMASTMANAGPILTQLGLGFEKSAALIGQLQKVGPGAEQALMGLSRAVATLTKAGIPAAEAFDQILNSIKNAKTPIEGTSLAIEIFGARAGPRLAEQIRQGRFEVDGLVKDVREMAPSIEGAAKATETWTIAWDKFKNQITLILEPLGKGMVEALKNIAEKLNEDVGPAIKDAVEWFGKLGPAAQGSVIGIAAVGAAAANNVVGIAAFINIIEKASGAGLFAWVAGLTSAAAAIEALGVAVAAFLGWKLGEWLDENIKLVRDFGDAVFGAGTIWDKWFKDLTGVTTETSRAQADLIKTTQALALKLAEQGIVVSRGAGSYEEYAKAVRDAAAAANTGLAAFEAFNKEAVGSPEDIAKRLAAAKAEIEAKKKAREEDITNQKKWAKETIKIQEEADKKVFELMQAQAAAFQKYNNSIKAMADDPWNTWNFAKVEAAEIRAKESTDAWSASLADAAQRAKVGGQGIADGLFLVKTAFDGFIGPKELINPGIPRDINALVDLLKKVGPEAQRSADIYTAAIRQMNSISLNQSGKDWESITKSVTDFAGKTREVTVPISQMTADLGQLGKAARVEAEEIRLTGTSQETLNQRIIETTNAYKAWQSIREPGEKNYLDGLRLQVAQLEAIKAAGQNLSIENQKILKEDKQALGEVNLTLTQGQKEWKKLGESIKSAFDTFEGAIARAILTGKGFADAFKSLFMSIAEDFLKYVIKQSLESLVKYMAGDVTGAIKNLKESFGDLGKFISGVFGTAGKATEATKGVAGAATQASGIIGSLSGVVGIIGLAVDVLSGIVQGFQMARLINLTGEIEVTTRGILNEALNLRRDHWDQHNELVSILRDGSTYIQLAINRLINALGLAPYSPSGSPSNAATGGPIYVPGTGSSSQGFTAAAESFSSSVADFHDAIQALPDAVTTAAQVAGQTVAGSLASDVKTPAPISSAPNPSRAPWSLAIDNLGNTDYGTPVDANDPSNPYRFFQSWQQRFNLGQPPDSSAQFGNPVQVFSKSVDSFDTIRLGLTDASDSIGVSAQAMVSAGTDLSTAASDLLKSDFVKNMPSQQIPGGAVWGPWEVFGEGVNQAIRRKMGDIQEMILDAGVARLPANGKPSTTTLAAGGAVTINVYVTNDMDGKKIGKAVADALSLQGLRA